MVQQLLGEFEHQIDSVAIIPSRGGVFEVTANEDLIFSKKATGRHAEYDEVAVPLRALLA